MTAKKTLWGASIVLMLALAVGALVGAWAGIGAFRDWVATLQGPPVTIMLTGALAFTVAALSVLVVAAFWVKAYLFALRHYRTTALTPTGTERG